jgi:hypothetical protein
VRPRNRLIRLCVRSTSQHRARNPASLLISKSSSPCARICAVKPKCSIRWRSWTKSHPFRLPASDHVTPFDLVGTDDEAIVLDASHRAVVVVCGWDKPTCSADVVMRCYGYYAPCPFHWIQIRLFSSTFRFRFKLKEVAGTCDGTSLHP